MDNPFERYDLDPTEGISAITQRLKELAEDAKDDAERERIRKAWEELTLHPARRLRAALFAHPETRAPLGSPPGRRRTGAGASTALGYCDRAPRPSLAAVVFDERAKPPGSAGARRSLDDDPLLEER
jgi:hypothetical protein